MRSQFLPPTRLPGRVLASALASVLAACEPQGAPAPPPAAGVRMAEGAEVPAGGGSSTANADTGCPSGMALVVGNYCAHVDQRCLRWLDPPGPYHAFRCSEYAPAECRAPRRPMEFCIDRVEQGGTEQDPRPRNHVSYPAARAACEERGARLCTESEWQFACEGEGLRPYPYGLVRDSTACNIDRFDLGRPGAGLHDLRAQAGGHPACSSPFGVLDLAGNLEEWVSRDPHTGGHETLLKGSWWLPGRSTCRATNAGHDQSYSGTETGFRCCAAVPTLAMRGTSARGEVSHIP